MKSIRHPATLLCFWDYDTQWGADRSRSGGGAKDWGRQEFDHTERLLETHAEYGVRACFAVVGAAALSGDRPYHDPAQIRRIHEAGNEVASHSFHHDWLPGLDSRGVLKTLQRSKDALEQCIGAPVISFVPPYNQPYDYPQGWAFSFSERRRAGAERTDLRGLCVALKTSGYRFCRVAYRPLPLQAVERVLRRQFDKPAHVEDIAGIACVRINTRFGFADYAIQMLRRTVEQGGLTVVYGHPHSIMGGDGQNLAHYVKFLRIATDLRRQGKLRIATPRELVQEPAVQTAPAGTGISAYGA